MLIDRLSFLAATASLVFALTSCGGGATSQFPASGAGDALIPSGSSQAIYVANMESDGVGNSVTAYPVDASGNIAPVRTIAGASTGLVQPNGIAFDSTGALYVAVNTFAGGGPDPLPGPSSILVFAPGAASNTAPARIITGPHTGIQGPAGITIDASGRLFVADAVSNKVLIFAPDAQGDAAPVAAIAGAHTALSFPVAVAISPTGSIFVANFLGSACGPAGAVTIYPPGASGDVTPIGSLGSTEGPRADRVTQPTALAFDRRGNIYVTNEGNGSITEWAPGANAYSTPIAVLYGPNTELDAPEGLAIDANDDIVVSNAGFFHRGIFVFAAHAQGDVAPIRIIRGSLTQLGVPMALTLAPP